MRLRRRVPFRLVFAAALAASAALPAAPVCDHDAAAGAPVAIEGLGSLRFPTSTRVPEAQRAFEQGMLELHLYHYPDAERSFQRAQALDRDFALAYWGEAMTATWPIWNTDFPERGRAALAKLGATPEARAAKAPTAREKGYLAAAEKLYGSGTIAERDAAFLAAMSDLARAYPDDDEAQLFHAQALLGVTRGERNVPNYVKAAEIAKRVHARNPNHPGASHYWIHGMDDPDHASQALEAAAALGKIAPSAAHAQHMVSHIYFGLGMWDEANAANQRARDAAHAQQRAGGSPVLACFHAVEWLHYGYYQSGRHRAAQKILDDCARDGRAALAWYRERPDRSSGYTRTHEGFERRLEASLSTMRSTALVESPFARKANTALDVRTVALGRYAAWDAFAKGWAAAQRGDTKLARAELAHLRAIAGEPPYGDELDHIEEYLAVLQGLLESAAEWKEGNAERALELARAAAAKYDAIPFDFGPPVPVKPPHELAGEIALSKSDAALALVEFDAALKLAPRRAQSLLGRARALKAKGDGAAAAKTYAELAAIWHSADEDLAERREVFEGAARAIEARR